MDKNFHKLRSSGSRRRQISFRSTVPEKIKKTKSYRDNFVKSTEECYSEIESQAKQAQYLQESRAEKEKESFEARLKDMEEREKKLKNLEEWEKSVSTLYDQKMGEIAAKALELDSKAEKVVKEAKNREEKLLEQERKMLEFLKRLNETQAHVETSPEALSQRKKAVIQSETLFHAMYSAVRMRNILTVKQEHDHGEMKFSAMKLEKN